MSAGPTPALARVHEVSRRTVYRVDLRARSRVYRRDVTVLLISELSRQTGVPPSTLRYYEQVGLLPPTERTAAEYRELLSQAGFQMTRVVQTASPLSVVEARAA